MLSFKEYLETQDDFEFRNKFESICETIIQKSIDYDKFWEELVEPSLKESHKYVSCNDLMNHIHLEFMNFGFSNQPQLNNQINPQQQNQQPNLQQQNQQQPNLSPEQLKRLQNFQSQADQQVGDLKNKFTNSMRGFLKSSTDEAKQQNNPHLWKIAQTFYDKILNTAQPVLDKFKMTARYAKPSYAQDFQNQRQQMMQSQQQALKQNLQNKFGNQPTVAPTPTM